MQFRFRNDTTVIIFVFVGCYIGSWLNYHVGFLSTNTPKQYPIEVTWPSIKQLGLIVLRTILGLAALALTEFLVKLISYSAVSLLFGKNRKELKKSESTLENKPKVVADLVTNALTYASIGFLVSFIMPIVFVKMGIDREGFYSEI